MTRHTPPIQGLTVRVTKRGISSLFDAMPVLPLIESAQAAPLSHPTPVLTHLTDTCYRFGQINATADEAAFHNTVLTSTQVATHYQALTIPEPATLALPALGGLAMVRRRQS